MLHFRRLSTTPVATGYPPIVWIATIAWGVALCLSLHAMSLYRWTPGAVLDAPPRWITNSQFNPVGRRWTLLMFAHPLCPCTEASLLELKAIAAAAQEPVQTVIAFYRPSESPSSWEKSTNWRIAQGIPGVSIIQDDDGQLARRFSAQCSGMTHLYAPDLTLRYSGGITAGRGHQGDNPGRDSLITLLQKAKVSPKFTQPQATCSVYGCSIFTTQNHASGTKSNESRQNQIN